MGGGESCEISTHHSPVSVSGMMDSSFHDVLQTQILWGKISTCQLIHSKRTGEKGELREEGGEWREEGEGKRRGGRKEEGGGRRKREG